MPYYQNGRVTPFKKSEHWIVFVGDYKDQVSYCLKQPHAVVEYWDGCEGLSIEELDLACDVRVAQLKISGEEKITLSSKDGRYSSVFSAFF